MKFIRTLSILLILFVGMIALPNGAAAKCPDVSSDLVCPDLHFFFQPERPVAGEEVTVVATWVEIRTANPVTNAEWLAKRSKPAYLWLWDHEPAELERIAYVDGAEKYSSSPQIVVPLQWNAKAREYQGTFLFPSSGKWYFTLGTVVPDALKLTMAAESDFVGPIQTIDVPAATGFLRGNLHWPPWRVWAAFILLSGLVISGWLWFRRIS
ncbi:MAG: hypothetical protein IPM53_22825 [Anaerolineaceae bacterium]|nr:hypothetical protein [Anaerolineaceae bacterium]